jgi:ketosteroid isomerase-like protein
MNNGPNDRPDLDGQIGELLRSELPVPAHAEGYRERVAALITADAVAREGGKRWFPAVHWPFGGGMKEQPVAMRPVPRRARRRPSALRVAVYASVAVVVVIGAAVGSLEALQHLGGPQAVVRIIDDNVVGTGSPSATQTTVVVTTEIPSQDVESVINNLLRAVNADDAEALLKLYFRNALLEDSSDGTYVEGAVPITKYWEQTREDSSFQVAAAGDPVFYDRYVAQPVKYSLPDGSTALTAVYAFEIDSDRRIVHQWIMRGDEG